MAFRIGDGDGDGVGVGDANISQDGQPSFNASAAFAICEK
jgi:hypothetical protein